MDAEPASVPARWWAGIRWWALGLGWVWWAPRDEGKLGQAGTESFPVFGREGVVAHFANTPWAWWVADDCRNTSTRLENNGIG